MLDGETRADTGLGAGPVQKIYDMKIFQTFYSRTVQDCMIQANLAYSKQDLI